MMQLCTKTFVETLSFMLHNIQPKATMDPNETEVMADQGNWTVEDCILVRVASQVGSFAVLQHSRPGHVN